jgi:hypothetical protein
MAVVEIMSLDDLPDFATSRSPWTHVAGSMLDFRAVAPATLRPVGYGKVEVFPSGRADFHAVAPLALRSVW